ncbi:hypothetical protein D3C79_1059940 [compost metagenome]
MLELQVEQAIGAGSRAVAADQAAQALLECLGDAGGAGHAKVLLQGGFLGKRAAATAN